MSLNAARAKFADLFTAAWAADYPAVPISYENRKFNQPVNKPWCAFNVIEAARDRQNIGTTTCYFVRTHGFIVVDIYTPADGGTAELYKMMDKAAGYLEEKNFIIDAQTASTTKVAQKNYMGQKAGFCAGTVLIPYCVDSALKP